MSSEWEEATFVSLDKVTVRLRKHDDISTANTTSGNGSPMVLVVAVTFAVLAAVVLDVEDLCVFPDQVAGGTH